MQGSNINAGLDAGPVKLGAVPAGVYSASLTWAKMVTHSLVASHSLLLSEAGITCGLWQRPQQWFDDAEGRG